jgi:hypothetical protein
MSNTTIQLKKSGQSGNTPADLNYGEVAINYADGKLFYKNGVGIKAIENQKTFSTINANNSLIIATTPTDILSLVAGSNITINSNTTTKTVTINSISDDTVAFAAYAQANNASGNTVALQAVNDTQNTNITSVNTFTQASYNKANNALANTAGAIFDGDLLIGAGGKLNVLTVGGNEGGEILLGKAESNTTLNGTGVTIDVYQNRLRFFEQGGSARGFYLDISTGGGGATTNIMSGGGGGGDDTVAFAAYAQANNASGNTVALQSQMTTTNTNITSVNTLATAAYDAANTARATPNVRGISSSGTYYPIFVDSNNAVATAESLYTDGGLSYDPATNFLTLTNGFLIGSISGTTGSFSTYVQVTGDNDYVAWGANTDARMMYNGTANTINLQMQFDATSFDIDYFNGVTSANKFAFYRANGDFQIYDGGIVFRDGTKQNTETLSIASAAFNAANTAAANTVYLQTINDNQNTSITNVNTFAQSAYDHSNTRFSSSGGTISGNVTIQNDLSVLGNVTFVGNVTSIQVTGNSGQFFGYASNGFNALYAGIPVGYDFQPQTIFQASANEDGYAQINIQNINTGGNASSDLVATADNGTENDTYVSVGIGSSTHNDPDFTLVGPNDGYLYVSGNTVTGGGDLVVGTFLENDVIFTAGGMNVENEQMRIIGSSNTISIRSNVDSSLAKSVLLGPVANVRITGGSSGQLLSTDGSGNLSFINPSTDLANAAFATANAALDLANSAYDTANSKYNTSGGTITGDVTIQNNLRVNSGNVSIGLSAGSVDQAGEAVAVGKNAGYYQQSNRTVAIGLGAGYNLQGLQAVGIGYDAGAQSQGQNAVAVGYLAGYSNQTQSSVAIGNSAGRQNQGLLGVAIGGQAGDQNQGASGVAIGYGAGYNTQGAYGIAIGEEAGYSSQGYRSIAIGNSAGRNSQPNNSIIISANGQLNAANSGLFIDPIRANTATDVLYYNTTTKEITYGVPTGGGGGSGAFTYNTTPPASGNTAGDRWVDSNDGTLYTYVNDGDSSQWVDFSAAAVSASVGGGAANAILYQAGVGNTTFTSIGTQGQLLTAGVGGVPIWTAQSSLSIANTQITGTIGATITNDTTTANTLYPLFEDATSGTLTSVSVSSTKLTYVPSTGTLSSTIVTSTSDEKLKENIVTISNPIDTIKKLRGVEYNWKDNGNKSMGVIAQEVEKVLPYLVSENQNGKTVMYQNMIGLLIEAVKEQQKQIDELRGKLDAN